jgi:hypothetical protein
MKFPPTHRCFELALAWAIAFLPLVTSADTRPATTAPVTDEIDDHPSLPKASTSKSQADPPAKEPPSPEEIAGWIANLDDNRYLVREAATRRLLDAGPASLDHLLGTANGGRPEPADRATWILRRLGSGKDLLLRRQALERLVLLKNRPQVAAAALEALAELRHSEAVQALEALGARYVTNEYGMAISLYYTPRLVLDQQWRGTDADLALVRNLVAVRQVIVIGTDVSIDGLTHLQQVNLLSDLLLYGTKLEPEDVPKVQQLLPQVAIDYRRGGLLGVGSNPPDGSGQAKVGMVTKGSAAEAAGIKVDDVIQKFEGESVSTFKVLTQMIAKHRAGEEVTLEILRDGQTMEFKVKLGAWQYAN